VDRDALKRKIVAAIFERSLNAFAALFHRDIGQADDVEITRLSRADVDFDLHQVGVDTEHRSAEIFEMHVSSDVTTSGRRKSNLNIIPKPAEEQSQGYP